jgi:hypothetical protein
LPTLIRCTTQARHGGAKTGGRVEIFLTAASGAHRWFATCRRIEVKRSTAKLSRHAGTPRTAGGYHVRHAQAAAESASRDGR